MAHTEKYLQAKWVTENPDGYDERDVIDAKRYCDAYLDGYNQALGIHDVVGRSEQLLAFLEWYDSNVCQNDCRSREELVKDFLSQ